MKIEAAVAWQKGLPLSLETVELDDPRPDEILVRLVATGICYTDIGAIEGRLPVNFPSIFGHEGAGVVVKTGDMVKSVVPGDHVVLLPDYCGHCQHCIQGETTYCENMLEIVFSGERDGDPRARQGDKPVRAAFFGQSSFATHALVTERNILKVKKEAPLPLYAALTCGVQTGAGAVLNAMPVTVGSSIAIFGAGAVGLAALMAAVNVGASHIIAIDRVPERLQLAEELGASMVIDINETDNLVDKIRKHTGGGTNFALDTTGSPDVVRAAVDALTTRGMCGFVTGKWGDFTLPAMPMLIGGKMIRGIMGGDATAGLLVQRLIDLYEAGRFPVERLVQYYPFEDINVAIEEMVSGKTIKPVLTFEGVHHDGNLS